MSTTEATTGRESDATQRTALTLDEVRNRAVLTVDEVAALLGISRPHAYRQAKAGTFPVKRIGQRLLVPVPALIAWLDEG